MAALTVQTILNTGILPTYAAAAAAGDSFVNNGRTFLHVKNANGGTARTVTINSLVNCSQGFDHDLTISVTASSEKMIGPFEMSRFNNTASSSVTATYSSEADLTVAAISL
jgi:hypothetical protein